MEGNVTRGDGPLVAFENLSENRQTKFVQALENGDLELGTMDEWGEPKIVEYEGERYRAEVYIC